MEENNRTKFRSCIQLIAMHTPLLKILLLLIVAIDYHSATEDLRAVYLESSTPTYCIDPAIYDIVRKRAVKCLAEGSTYGELHLLRNMSVTDYHHSHELLAYRYFVEMKENVHRRSCSEADFELIPLLPLSWRSGHPTSTSCTAGGYCPKHDILGDPSCSIPNFIDGLLSIVAHIKTTRGQSMSEGIPKFTIASTYNLRTIMAFGLPSSSRSGAAYSAVTSFVTSTAIGACYAALSVSPIFFLEIIIFLNVSAFVFLLVCLLVCLTICLFVC